MNVAVVFGGKSCEHYISIITAMQAISNISKKHTVFPVYIDNDGIFWTGDALNKMSAFKKDAKVKRKKICFMPQDNRPHLCKNGKALAPVDVALLCNHGVNGEDGTVQSYFELSNIPYTGSGMRASAVGMDKIMMKRIFESVGLPVLPYCYLSYHEYMSNENTSLQHIINKLEFPLIVKPSNLGSSIGIGIAKNADELKEKIDAAFMWDNEIVVEVALTDFTEYNCAVLGGETLTLSQIEQPIGWKDFLTFDDKYTKKTDGDGRLFPAPIAKELESQIHSIASSAFKALGCDGVARIDFLYKDTSLYINEINTIPGALSNYLFPIDYSELIEKLIELAIKKKQMSERLNYRFNPSFELKNGTKVTK